MKVVRILQDSHLFNIVVPRSLEMSHFYQNNSTSEVLTQDIRNAKIL